MSTASELLLTAHLGTTAAMVGLIWFVQLVHYPLFGAVGPERFSVYEREHQRRTAWVVGPLMGLEGATALMLVIAPPDELGRTLPVIGLALLAVIQASTVGLQVPRHAALARGYDSAVARTLVDTNWVRTLGWSARGVVAAAMVMVAT